MGAYLKHALENFDKSVLNVACGIISDLSNGMRDRLNEYLGDFVPCLIKILISPESDRSVKISSLHAMSSLSLNSGKLFNKHYLSEYLGVLSQAATMSVSREYMNQQDNELKNFLRDLRCEVLENYATILISV